VVELDFSRCRDVWVPDDSEAGGFWSPPFEHVKEGVRWIIEHPYGLLATEMGGAKTAQALIAAQFLHDMDVIDRVIVIAPASVRPKVWYDRDLGQIAEQVFEDKRVLVSEYHQRIRQWSAGPPSAKELRIIVSNYEFIRIDKNLAELLPYCGPRTFLILDESSAVRTWDSNQTRAVLLLRWQARRNKKGGLTPVLGAPRCGRVLEMNGTPVAESPLDLFAQANILHPSILDCRYVTNFKARYAIMAPVRSNGGHLVESPYPKRVVQPDGTVKYEKDYVKELVGWSDEGIADLQRRMAPYVLRREAKQFGVDFALPPVGLDVSLTPETWRIYKDMRDNMVAWLESGVATARQAGVKAIRLAQITSGFLGGIEDDDLSLFNADDEWEFTDENREVDLAAVDPATGADDPLAGRRPVAAVQAIGREKLDFALDWQEEMLRRNPSLKLLTWCRFVPELRRYLAEVSAKFGHPVGAACGQKVLEGEHTKKYEREQALRLLHPKTAPPGAVTVGATQGTGAIGLNFTACRTVLDMSYDASPWKKKQGDARVNRTGQTGPVSFHYLVAVGPRGQKTIDHHVMLQRLGKMNLNDLTVAGWVKVLREE
jgi:hypothetical protein